MIGINNENKDKDKDKKTKNNNRDKRIICRLSSVCLAWLIMLSMPGRAQNLRFVVNIVIIIVIIVIINVIIAIIMIMIIIIRCYVCGGNSGTPCGQGNGEVQIITFPLIQLIQVRSRCITTLSSHYSTLLNFSVLSALPQELDEDGALIHDPVQECNDLINNRGCVKQYVNKGVFKVNTVKETLENTRRDCFLRVSFC